MVFEFCFEKELLRLEQELSSRTYLPATYTCFAITDPKLREVWAADFRDRVVHHLLVDFLEPIFEPKFIFHSYACRKNKGAHLAIHYLKKAIADQKLTYYLQIDIQSFFTSIDKNILFALASKHIYNSDILWLTRTVIFHSPQDNFRFKGDISLIKSIPRHKSLLHSSPDKGLPIGNLSSQFFANLYLNELDQFCKHNLKCKYYYRYMDDMVILHHDKNQLLKWQNEISKFLERKLKLRLHPKKIKLIKISNGIDFLGYVVKPSHVLIRKRTVKKLKNKLWHFNHEIITFLNNDHNQCDRKSLTKIYDQIFYDPYRYFNNPKIIKKFQHIYTSINSTYGSLRHANCYGLRKSLYKKHFEILKIYLKPANRNYDYFIWNEPFKG